MRARLTMDGADPLTVQTLDIGQFGMGLTALRETIAMGAQGLVEFEILLDGHVSRVALRMRVAYCIPADPGFRAGVQFLELDSAGAALVAHYVQQGPATGSV